MGALLTAHSDKDYKIKKLQKRIDDQNAKISNLVYMVNLLECGATSDYCIKSGIVTNVNIDSAQLLEDTKKNLDYEYLVFSGGSIKGFAHTGAVKVLEQKSVMNKIKGYGGTSSGSLVATLLAIGYNADELIELMISIDLDKFIDDKWGYIRDAYNFIDDYGLAPGDYLYGLIGDLIEAKTGNPDYTIDQLYNDTGKKLVIVGTDMNLSKSIYFYPNHSLLAYKNIPIRKAVRISMSLPYVFEPVEFNGNICVDGGVLDNFPLHVFDGEYPGEPLARLNMTPPNPKVLGINIVSINDIKNYTCENRKDITCLFDYSVAYITAFLSENEKRMRTPSYWLRSVNIITPDYDTLQFDISQQEKLDLVQLGKDATTNFLGLV